jgi:hypothetical protein
LTRKREEKPVRKGKGIEEGKGKSRGWEGGRDEGMKSHLQGSNRLTELLLSNVK